MELDHEYDDLVHRDATALLRPRTGLKDMFLELDPGTRPSRRARGRHDPVHNTPPDVNPDEILSALDDDTRDYLKLLINGAGKGLERRRATCARCSAGSGRCTGTCAALNELVKRRANLARLIDNYGYTSRGSGKEDDELTALVAIARACSARSRREDAEHLRRGLAPAERAGADEERALRSRARPGRGPAFEALRPACAQLDETNEELRPFAEKGEPILRDAVRPFVRTARPYVDNLRPAGANLAKASPDLRESFFELNRLFNMLAYNPGGHEALTGDPEPDRARDEGFLFWLGWVSHNTISLFATADAQARSAASSCSPPAPRTSSCARAGRQRRFEHALGLRELLNDPDLCPSS